MKSVIEDAPHCQRKSLPVRGAWIEISRFLYPEEKSPASLPVRGAWIEMPGADCRKRIVSSLPVRGAWIEIFLATCRKRL